MILDRIKYISATLIFSADDIKKTCFNHRGTCTQIAEGVNGPRGKRAMTITCLKV